MEIRRAKKRRGYLSLLVVLLVGSVMFMEPIPHTRTVDVPANHAQYSSSNGSLYVKSREADPSSKGQNTHQIKLVSGALLGCLCLVIGYCLYKAQVSQKGAEQRSKSRQTSSPKSGSDSLVRSILERNSNQPNTGSILVQKRRGSVMHQDEVERWMSTDDSVPSKRHVRKRSMSVSMLAPSGKKKHGQVPPKWQHTRPRPCSGSKVHFRLQQEVVCLDRLASSVDDENNLGKSKEVEGLVGLLQQAEKKDQELTEKEKQAIAEAQKKLMVLLGGQEVVTKKMKEYYQYLVAHKWSLLEVCLSWEQDCYLLLLGVPDNPHNCLAQAIVHESQSPIRLVGERFTPYLAARFLELMKRVGYVPKGFPQYVGEQDKEDRIAQQSTKLADLLRGQQSENDLKSKEQITKAQTLLVNLLGGEEQVSTAMQKAYELLDKGAFSELFLSITRVKGRFSFILLRSSDREETCLADAIAKQCSAKHNHGEVHLSKWARQFFKQMKKLNYLPTGFEDRVGKLELLAKEIKEKGTVLGNLLQQADNNQPSPLDEPATQEIVKGRGALMVLFGGEEQVNRRMEEACSHVNNNEWDLLCSYLRRVSPYLLLLLVPEDKDASCLAQVIATKFSENAKIGRDKQTREKFTYKRVRAYLSLMQAVRYVPKGFKECVEEISRLGYIEELADLLCQQDQQKSEKSGEITEKIAEVRTHIIESLGGQDKVQSTMQWPRGYLRMDKWKALSENLSINPHHLLLVYEQHISLADAIANKLSNSLKEDENQQIKEKFPYAEASGFLKLMQAVKYVPKGFADCVEKLKEVEVISNEQVEQSRSVTTSTTQVSFQVPSREGSEDSSKIGKTDMVDTPKKVSRGRSRAKSAGGFAKKRFRSLSRKANTILRRDKREKSERSTSLQDDKKSDVSGVKVSTTNSVDVDTNVVVVV